MSRSGPCCGCLPVARPSGSWIVPIAGVVLSTTGQYTRMFPTPEAALSFAHDLEGNTVLTAFTGRLTAPTLHGLILWKIADVAFTLNALMATLIVLRHTRAAEESGRQELLRSTPISRYAPARVRPWAWRWVRRCWWVAVAGTTAMMTVACRLGRGGGRDARRGLPASRADR